MRKNASLLFGLLIFASVSTSYLVLNSQKEAGLSVVEQIEFSDLDMKLLGRSASAAQDKSLEMLEARDALHSGKKRSDRKTPEWTPLVIEQGMREFSLDKEKAMENNGNTQTPANDSQEVAADLKSLAILDSEGLDPGLMRDAAGKITSVSGSFDLSLATGEILETIASVEALIQQHSSVFAIGVDERAVVDTDVDTLTSGENILRLNRNYKGLPVWGKQLVVTVENGRAKSVAGNFKGVEQDLDLSAKLSESEIEELALSEMRTSGYKTATVLDSQEGIYFFTPIPQHAHKVTVQTKIKRWDLFFSPSTNKLIAKIPKFYEVSTESSGTDLMGAVQSFWSDSVAGKYILRDNSFPIDGGTKVYDWNGTEPEFKWSESFFSDSGWDPAAVSAHVNAFLSYKYFLDRHQRNSFDGNGTELVAYVNQVDENGDPVDNAGWGSGAMFYGAGSGVNFAIALDIAAHEFAHGVIESTSNLIYHNQSGALNESFADFFGAMVDRDDWLIGESLYDGTNFVRSLKTPESRGQPSRWQDYADMPDDEDNDHGGVHINSGIQNRALYLIAEGLSEEGLGASIGKQKTEQIAYKTLERLTSDARFIDSANTMILQARSLFGEESLEAEAVTLAWATVGVIESAVASSVGGSNKLTLAKGDDVIAHLYPKDGTMDNLWSEEYDLYVQTINQPFTAHIPSLQYGPLNDVAAVGSKPSLDTSERGFLWISYIGNDARVRSTMLSNYGNDIVLEIDDVKTVTRTPNGQKVALVEISSNKIWIYNRLVGASESITVRGPNYSEVAQDDVVTRVDAINFDSTGQKIIFDYEICRPLPDSDCETMWSIGIYDLGTKVFYYPFVSADTNLDIGFPRFANATNKVIAFDVVDWNDFDANGKASSESRVFDLVAQKTLGAARTNTGTSRTSSWGVPSFVANDKALAIQAQTDTTTTLYQISLDENYSFVPDTSIWLTPFQSGFAQAHRNGYLSITSKLNPNSGSLDLGTLKLGSGASGEFTITNEGNRELVITSIFFSDSALSSNLTNRALSAGEALTFDVSLDSTLEKEGNFTGTLTINHNGDNPSAVFGVLAYLDIDIDGDGILNTSDPDDDNDGVKDFRDAYPLISLGGLADFDNDGRPNDCDDQCQALGMSADLDDDDDSMPDLFEKANGLNPLDGTDCPHWYCTKLSPAILAISSSSFDLDKDGLTRAQEEAAGTNWQVADTDGDGLSDGDEVNRSTNPLAVDSDGDGLNDGEEITRSTNPLVADSDGDTMPDGEEVAEGLDPTDADDCPRWYCGGGIMHIIPAIVP